MSTLMIETSNARALAGELLRTTDQAIEAAHQAVAALALAELDSGAPGLAFDVADLLRDVASQLLRAAEITNSFVLPGISAMPDTRWNRVRQIGSHNSFQSPYDLSELYDQGVRAFEFDLHASQATDELAEYGAMLGPQFELGAAAYTALQRAQQGPEPSSASDWFIYHHVLDTESRFDVLGDALGAVAALPHGEPLTIVLDMKDPLDQAGTARLDSALHQYLGSRLYRPQDLLARAPQATSVADAVALRGWPTMAELDGRVLVLLTANVDSYRSQLPSRQAAFVAAKPSVSAIVDPNIVVYNVRSNRTSVHVIEQLQQSGQIVRTWGPPDAAALASNLHAVDL